MIKLAAFPDHDINFHIVAHHQTPTSCCANTQPPSGSCPLFDSHLPPKRGNPHPHTYSLCERASSSDQTLVMCLKGSLQRSVQPAAAAMHTGPGITTA